jgi:hypothetical protein
MEDIIYWRSIMDTGWKNSTGWGMGIPLFIGVSGIFTVCRFPFLKR